MNLDFLEPKNKLRRANEIPVIKHQMFFKY